MVNKDIAKIFFETAKYFQMKEDSFRVVAYKKAANNIRSLEEDIREIYKRGGLKELEKINGVGRSTAEKIEEFLETGKVRLYEQLKKETPIKLDEISSIEGMGPKRAKILYNKLGIKNLKELEKAAKECKIASLEGFGEKTEKNILEGIEFLKSKKGRFLLGEVDLVVKEIIAELKKVKEIEKISPAGSFRRRKETVGDVDILAVSNSPEKVMDFFCAMFQVEKVWGKGLKKSSVRTKDGFDIDLRVVAKKSYGSALQYFTGSKEHNIATRKIAIQKGLKLNEYGVFKKNKRVAGKTEEEVYKKIGLEWIPPEMRENRGEVELAQKNTLPDIIGYGDIKGDLHCHSNWDGGEHSIGQMAEKAVEMGYEYIGISDHTKFLKIEKGLNEKQLLAQNREIEKLNKKSKIRILHGVEANIIKDGSLDIKDNVLEKLDYVIAGVHSLLKMNRSEMTERIITAMKNPNVRIISHLTGRLLGQRDECQLDFEEIFIAAKKYNVILEINSSPQRLDLKDINIKKAKEAGVKMIINTDSHHRQQMNLMEFGIAQARRGWAEKKDIINTNPIKEFLKCLQK